MTIEHHDGVVWNNTPFHNHPVANSDLLPSGIACADVDNDGQLELLYGDSDED